MKIARQIVEVFLMPGDFYFGDVDTRIRTILGSCVSITMWHPTRLIGGMCHYMLPSRTAKGSGVHDGRYAEDAMQLFLQEIKSAGTRPCEYSVMLFGAGNMFPSVKRSRAHVAGFDLDDFVAAQHHRPLGFENAVGQRGDGLV